MPPSEEQQLLEELRLAQGAAADLAVFARLFEALEVPLAIWSLSPGGETFDLIASNQPAAALIDETTEVGFDPPTFTQVGLHDRLRGLLSSPVAIPLGEFCTTDGLRVFSARGLSIADGVVGVGFFEVTHRRILEQERLELVQRMQHTQKLESLGVLAGGIAHDFNNLLAGIMGNTSLALLEVAPTARARPLLERIEATARIASELTRQMLAYSGRGRFVIEPIDLSQLVEEMARLLEVSLTSRAVVRYEMAANLPMVDADASQVRQVVMNLVTNASEAVEGTRSGSKLGPSATSRPSTAAAWPGCEPPVEQCRGYRRRPMGKATSPGSLSGLRPSVVSSGQEASCKSARRGPWATSEPALGGQRVPGPRVVTSRVSKVGWTRGL